MATGQGVECRGWVLLEQTRLPCSTAECLVSTRTMAGCVLSGWRSARWAVAVSEVEGRQGSDCGLRCHWRKGTAALSTCGLAPARAKRRGLLYSGKSAGPRPCFVPAYCTVHVMDFWVVGEPRLSFARVCPKNAAAARRRGCCEFSGVDCGGICVGLH